MRSEAQGSYVRRTQLRFEITSRYAKNRSKSPFSIGLVFSIVSESAVMRGRYSILYRDNSKGTQRRSSKDGYLVRLPAAGAGGPPR